MINFLHHRHADAPRSWCCLASVRHQRRSSIKSHAISSAKQGAPYAPAFRREIGCKHFAEGESAPASPARALPYSGNTIWRCASHGCFFQAVRRVAPFLVRGDLLFGFIVFRFIHVVFYPLYPICAFTNSPAFQGRETKDLPMATPVLPLQKRPSRFHSIPQDFRMIASAFKMCGSIKRSQKHSALSSLEGACTRQKKKSEVAYRRQEIRTPANGFPRGGARGILKWF